MHSEFWFTIGRLPLSHALTLDRHNYTKDSLYFLDVYHHVNAPKTPIKGLMYYYQRSESKRDECIGFYLGKKEYPMGLCETYKHYNTVSIRYHIIDVNMTLSHVSRFNLIKFLHE